MIGFSTCLFFSSIKRRKLGANFSGPLNRYQGHMVLVCGNQLEAVGYLFLNFFGMTWVMVLMWSFGRMYGVGIVLLKMYFQSCMVLVGQGRLLCRRSCVSLMGGFIGTSGFVAQCRIGRRKHWICVGVCFIPQMYRALELIRFVGNQQWVKVLRLEVFTMLSPSSDISYPWKMVWQSKIPPRVAFFSWTAS